MSHRAVTRRSDRRGCWSRSRRRWIRGRRRKSSRNGRRRRDRSCSWQRCCKKNQRSRWLRSLRRRGRRLSRNNHYWRRCYLVSSDQWLVICDITRAADACSEHHGRQQGTAPSQHLDLNPLRISMTLSVRPKMRHYIFGEQPKLIEKLVAGHAFRPMQNEMFQPRILRLYLFQEADKILW